jgi:hypothetical protein
MTNDLTWLATFATVTILVCYELALAVAQRRAPGRLARTAHASLRQEWFEAVSAQKGSEILAVQTLRNSLMSATMTASTAALGLVATATLASPSLHSIGEATGVPSLTPRLALELALLALLFSSLVSSAMAVRYYNHAGFIGAMPIDSEARRRWGNAGSAYVRRAGVLYSWALRHLILVAPVLASILHPATGPVAALLVVAVLFGFDRIGTS